MTNLIPLSQWLLHDQDRLVAVDMETAISSSAYTQRVADWYLALQDLPGNRWAVYHSDTMEFSAILLALWQLGRTACIPGDNCPGTIDRLLHSVSGFLGQFTQANCITSAPSRSVKTLPKWHIPDADLEALEIYSSGSTGEPKAIIKTLVQLECEIEALESLWPSSRKDTVLGTVSHQHFYGMIFRLLWPLSSGRPFARKLCEYTEDIHRQAKLYPAYSLISSPSHLARLNTALDWHQVAGNCIRLISSTAPLKKQDSHTASQIIGINVHEIYGSSETGAIAWRTQTDPDTDAQWQSLPNVDLSPNEDGTLEVASTFLGDIPSFTMPDRVTFNPEGQFTLIGRVDSIVKIEGKRVSLVAIEQRLQDSPLVSQAKALTVTRNRVETAVVVALTESGNATLQTYGRITIIKQLKSSLATHFEGVVLPRRWRFLKELPYNQQGKLPLKTLQSMFERKTTEWPQVLKEQIEADQLTLTCYIPSELIYFDGHFDKHPILPGIVQVHWAEAFGRRYLKVAGCFYRLEAVKFQQVILPHSEVLVTLKYNRDKNKLTFRYESAKGIHSSGRICFI